MFKISTRFKLAIATLAIGLSLGATSHAAEWNTIDCAGAPFRIAGGSSCKKIERVVGTGITGQIQGEDHLVAGSAGGFTFWAAHFGPPPLLPNSLPGWKAYGTPTSERIIRAYARATAHDFGSYQGFDHTGYMQYRRGRQHCIGFDHGGAPNAAGYLYFVRGEICANAPLGTPATLLRDLLSAMEIAEPGRGVTNALGKTPTSLPWVARASK